jgi:hypothetical protein
MHPATIGQSLPQSIDYPCPHDFVLIASDGVKFNLSRVVLIATSSFFADMFTVGETRSPEESTVNAAEGWSVLDGLFSISYAHPNKPKPVIDSFSQLANLVQVAEKYGMHQALDYLSAQLALPRIVAGATVEPFTVTHPVESLALANVHGFIMPARLALREVLNAGDTVWGVTQEDEDLKGYTLNYRILKRINRMRATRFNTYKTFIESLVACTTSQCNNYNHGHLSLSNWKIELLKKICETPNVAAFTTAFFTGWTCGYCGMNTNRLNLDVFKTFIETQAAQEAELPQLY